MFQFHVNNINSNLDEEVYCCCRRHNISTNSKTATVITLLLLLLLVCYKLFLRLSHTYNGRIKKTEFFYSVFGAISGIRRNQYCVNIRNSESTQCFFIYHLKKYSSSYFTIFFELLKGSVTSAQHTMSIGACMYRVFHSPVNRTEIKEQ